MASPDPVPRRADVLRVLLSCLVPAAVAAVVIAFLRASTSSVQEAIPTGLVVLLAGGILALVRFNRLIRREVEALRERFELLQAFSEGTEDSIHVKDREGRYLLCNAASLRLKGRTREESLGKTAEAFFEPEIARRVREADLTVMESGESMVVEEQVILPDGPHVLQVIKSPYRDLRGNVVGVLGIARDITELKRMERELRNSEDRYRSVVELSPDPILIVQDGRLTYVNPACASMVGLEGPEELLGKPILDLLHPDDRPLGRERGRMLISTGRPLSPQHFRVRHRDGSWIEVESRAGPCRHEGREAFQVVVRDVTEQKRIERSLRENEAFLRLSQRIGKVGSWEWDIATGRVRWSEVMARLHGLDLEEFDGTLATAASFFHPDDRPRFDAAAARLIETGEPTPMEYRIVMRDGTERHLWGTAEVFLGPAGKPVRCIGAVIDITERVSREQSLRSAAAFKETVIRTAAEGICVAFLIDEHPFIRFSVWNERMSEITGWSMEEINRRGWYQTVHPDPEVRSRAEARLERMRQGEDLRGEEWAITRRDGATRTLSISTSMVEMEDRRAVVALMQDVTERKAAEAALEQERNLLAQRVEERTCELSRAVAELARADRLKDEFLANVSHELRTPLTSILGLTEVLAEQMQGPLNDKQKQSLKSVEASGRHLLSLINDILDLAKIGAGKLELEMTPTSVETVCAAALQIVRQPARSKRLLVTCSIEPRAAVVQADERRLKQILVNLLANAVKFTPPDGEIGLEVVGDRDAEAIRLTVRDTGVGIPRDQMGRLFQPFVQVEGGLSRPHEGTGLGLVLVDKMTRLHGGAISVESEPGRGSRFTVTIPWDGAEGVEEPRPSSDACRTGADARSPGDRKPLVLVADDTEVIAKLIVTALGSMGCRVVIAKDGREALARAEQERPDLILTDIQMPGMDGLTLIGRLKSDSVMRGIPIIVLTGQTGRADRSECLKAGAAAFLEKPFALQSLIRTVEMYCPQLERESDAARQERLPLVLMAEDNETLIDLVSDYLSAHGFRVVVARNGREALDRAAEQPPDVILMDVQMPGMDGLETIRRLRGEFRSSAPVIALTALAMPGDRERCLAAGADEYLSKPFRMPALLALIEKRVRQVQDGACG